MKGPVISIKDLLAECVRKAYIIICLCIVCAVALCAVKFVKDTNTLKATVQQNKNENIVAEIELSEEEELQVQDYINAVNERDGAKEYLRDSIYINCNPYDTDYVHIQYQVESSSEEHRRDAVLALRTYILGGGVASYLSEQTNGIEPKYFTELIRCESITNTSYLDNGIIEIIMYAGSEEDALTYAAWIQECLDAYMVTLNQTGIDGVLHKISEKTLTYTLTKIISDRDSAQSRYEEYKQNVSTLEATLSIEQLQVANALLGEEISDEVADKDTSVKTESASISLKYLILGAILGIGAGAALIAANYILWDTVKTPNIAKDIYGIRQLGRFQIKKQTIFDKLAERIFYNGKEVSQQEEQQMLLSKIKILCEKRNVKEVVFVGNMSTSAGTVIEGITKELNNNGIKSVMLDEICNDSQSFCIANKTKNVILIQTLKATKYGDLDKVVSLCEESEIAILGYVVFDA